MLFGLGFIALGVGLTLQNLGLVQHVMAILLPAFLILAGLAVMTRGLAPRRVPRRDRGGRGHSPLGEPVLAHDASLQLSATMSGLNHRCDSQDFQGGTLNVVMGGIELDLRQASISNQATLQVNVVGGGIKIRIPHDWQLQLNISPVLGGIEDKTVPPMHSDKILLLQGEVVLGGIEIGH
ncbi:hypothetical protein THUN1379_12030 [Paludibacterium sp. THUN1379]|nr:hypothetical protein THUN1379_12030 [Paludibacterium sp. THUN1379]